MKLTFLGTRGQIEARTPRHRMHTSLLVAYRGRRVMIDAGTDWTGRVEAVAPHALVLTHAHPDHAEGVRFGAPCPVHASEESWSILAGYPEPPSDRHRIDPRTPVEVVAGVIFEAFPVQHSTRAPAVGYRITAGRRSLFYAPDVAHLPAPSEALRGIDLYVGDGATLERSMVRRQGEELVGHAPVRTQLGWCAREGVTRALITHCGAEVVEGDPRRLGARLRLLGAERGVEVAFAHDGMEQVLR